MASWYSRPSRQKEGYTGKEERPMTLTSTKPIASYARVGEGDESNTKISAAACDGGGRLVALERMDGRDLGERLWQPGEGSGLGGIWPAERRNGGARRPASPRGIAAAEGGHMIMARAVRR